MVNQVKNFLKGFREFWDRQTKKRRIVISAALAGVLLTAIVATMLLNVSASGYESLYSGLDPAESAVIYQTLKDMSVDVQINSAGQVMVKKADKDMLLIELSGLGYPKSAPSYDIFTTNAGLTTTEFEKKQYLLFQLQDRLEKTIGTIEGVKSAIVTLVIPEESSYVWQEDTEQESTASILITMESGMELSASRISAIKNLVASSVPKMAANNVTIVDAITSLEMYGESEKDAEGLYNSGRLDFETQMEDRIAEKAKNVLSLSYSENQLRVSSTVVIDYSKMITEQMDYQPEEDGNGVPSKVGESYTMDASEVASGVAGEEDNTDIPIYVDNNNDGVPETVYHVRDIDYFVSYVKQQIEKDNTELVSASLAVTLADPALTEEKRQMIVSLVSDATNVPEENITVVSFMAAEDDEGDQTGQPDETPTEQPTDLVSFIEANLPYLIVGAGVFVVLLIALIILLAIRRKKHPKEARQPSKTKAKGKMSEAEELEESLADAADLEAEAQRRRLRDAAIASVSKDNAVADEVRQFADENPEITASLIRAWLKESE